MEQQVLIVDDDSRNTFALSAVLRARGFRSQCASDMREAFALLDAQPHAFRAILIDMMMPDIDGYQAIPMLKGSARYGHIPVIAVTAQAMAGDREKCVAAGADGYVPKPVDIDVLMKLLRQPGFNVE